MTFNGQPLKPTITLRNSFENLYVNLSQKTYDGAGKVNNWDELANYKRLMNHTLFLDYKPWVQKPSQRNFPRHLLYLGYRY